MKARVLILLLFLVYSSQVIGSSFKIKPYTLLKDNGELLLNFELEETKNLHIDRYTEKGLSKISNEYGDGLLHQVNLGQVLCQQDTDLRVVDQASGEEIFYKKIPSTECGHANKTNQSRFVFGFVSDTQEFTERHQKIANVITKHLDEDEFQFVLNGGDVVQDGHKHHDWKEFLDVGHTYMKRVPLVAAIGNHDYRKGGKNQLPPLFKKYLRWDGGDEFGNLHFQFENFDLIVFNSNFPRLTRKKEKQFWLWIEKKLKDASMHDRPVILASHFPVYSSSMNRFTSSSVRKLRRHLPDLVKEYGVKIVLGGHTHMYERSERRGTHYIVAGPAGGRPNSPTWRNKYRKYFNDKILTFSKIIIEGRMFHLETYNEHNHIVDRLSVIL
jgi:hypothetical protein